MNASFVHVERFMQDFKSRLHSHALGFRKPNLSNEEIYSFDYTAYFPHYAHFGVGAELLLNEFFSQKSIDREVARLWHYIQLEDEYDIAIFLRMDTEQGFYHCLAEMYHRLYFLHQYQRVIYNWISHVRHTSHPNRPSKIRMLADRHELVKDAQCTLLKNIQHYKAHNQLICLEDIKRDIDTAGFHVWFLVHAYPSLKHKVVNHKNLDANFRSVARGKRTTWSSDISTLVMDYVMDLHPMHKKPVEILDSDSDEEPPAKKICA